MSELNHRKEVLEEIDKLGVPAAIDAAENLVRKVRREAAAAGVRGAANGGAAPRLSSRMASAEEHAAAKAFLEQSEGGRAVVLLLRGLISDDDLTALIRGIAQGCASHTHELVAERDKQIRALEVRIEALEKKKGLAPLASRLAQLEARQLSYEGVWSETKAYNAGSFVTHAGSLWFAEDTSVGVRPGAGSSAWKLAVKRGRAER